MRLGLFFTKLSASLIENHFTRQENNYRVYNDNAVERLELIKSAKQAGLTLREIREHIDEWEEDVLTDEQKRQFFTGKLAGVEQRIEGLKRVRAYLMTKLEELD